MYIDTQTHTIDSCISKSRKECRVFWLQSWDRTILDKALNYSSVLFGKIITKSTDKSLTTNKVKPGEYFKYLDDHGLIAEYDDFDQKNKQSAKIGNDTSRVDTSRVVCLYLNDFQLFKQGETLHHFLSHNEFRGKILLLVSTEMSVPIGFENDVLVVKVGSPTYEDLKAMISDHISNNMKLVEKLSKDLTGYSETEIRTILHLLKSNNLLQDTQKVNKSRDEYLKKYKEEKLTKDGSLSIKWIEEDEGGGMRGYTDWLDQHKVAFTDPDYAQLRGISDLKGILMTGLPGTGKTVMAKSTAYRLRVPYVELKLDELSTDKYGGSEKLLRMYRDKVDSLGNAVVCIDEIEKSLGDDGKRGMHEVKKEQLQILLKWMQDSKGKFFFLTCNNVEALPPELKRDGRLSERFYTFMPTQEELAEMFHKFIVELNKKSGERLYERELIDKSKGLLEEVISELIKNAKKSDSNNSTEYSKDPFLTGANLRKLIENTNNELAKSNVTLPYSYELYRDTMLLCASNPDFVFYGESDFDTIAKLWLYVRDNKLRCVSSNCIVSPFDSDFDDSKMKFHKLNQPDTLTYEKWFAYRFKKKMNERTEKAQV